MTAPSLTEARETDRVAAEIARCGSLDAAIAQLAHDACGAEWGSPVHDIYREALAERSARRQATESLDERASRLGLEAADLDARAGDLEAEAAQDELVVTVRRAKFGTDDAAALYIASRARVARQMAAGLSAEAYRLRSQAAAIRDTQRRAKSYASDVLSSLQVGE